MTLRTGNAKCSLYFFLIILSTGAVRNTHAYFEIGSGSPNSGKKNEERMEWKDIPRFACSTKCAGVSLWPFFRHGDFPSLAVVVVRAIRAGPSVARVHGVR